MSPQEITDCSLDGLMNWRLRSLWLLACSVGFCVQHGPTLICSNPSVESLVAEIQSLKEEIRGLKHENKQLHKLAHNYATNMKRKIDQLQENDGQILLDHRRFVGLFQPHLPSSSGAAPRSEAPTDQPPIPPPSVAPPTAETSPTTATPPTTTTSPKQPL